MPTRTVLILTTCLGTTLFGCASTTTTTPETEPAAAIPDVPPAPTFANYTETIRGSDVQFEMVWIPEGHFWIGRTEVTWDEFLPYCDFEESGAVPPGVDAVTKPSKPLEGSPYDRDWGIGQRPAVGVSWNAAKQYCAWLSINTGNDYRLPHEDEWLIACSEDGQTPLDDYAWYDATSGGRTQEVGQKAANAHGLHDMLGNLWEYCDNPYDPAKPKRAALRGGSWKDDAATVTPLTRLRFDRDWILADPNVPPGVWWVPDGDHLGFRILRPGPRDDAPEETTP